MLKIFKKKDIIHDYPLMRQPDRLPRCYDMTESERLEKVKEWNNRNIWNDPELAKDDKANIYYGA